ncbi:unnamed protein product [Closterium sp. Naga37s-1]|nr:unnamed protein product [Closterium sp. Naga37s-1]
MASLNQEGSEWRANGTSDKGTILVTGGAGYIGSHTCVQLLEEGYRVVVVDNLDNSSEEAITRVVELTGDKGRNLTFFKVDLLDRPLLEEVFKHTAFDAVIHFAGLKAVGESVQQPLRYYHNNITGTIVLLELMAQYGCSKIVFSSSATVYGQPKRVPCTEEDELQTLNPYGRTKLYIENMLRDMQAASAGWQVLLLRYFNPVGAHPSGRIGEDPQGIPNNLMPFIQQVAVGRRPFLSVFGDDYPTRDGTGVRDYIHVMDLAAGHTAALRKIFTTPTLTCDVYNLGTGRGQSVLEMVAGFEKASGREIPVKMCPRRPGDCSEVYALTDKAERELKWRAGLTLDDMCRGQWNWARDNPWGYSNPPEEAQAEQVVVVEGEGEGKGGKAEAAKGSPVSEPRTPPLLPASPETNVNSSESATSSAGSAPSPCVLDSTPPVVAHKGSLVRAGSGSSVDSLEELTQLGGSQAVA